MLRASLKSLLARKMRLLMSAIAVVLGVAFVAGSFIFTDTLGKSFDSIMTNSVGDVVVRYKNAGNMDNFGSSVQTLPGSLVKQLAAVPGAARADGNITDVGTFVISKKGKLIGGQGAPGMGVNHTGGPAANGNEGFSLATGSWPKQDGEIVLDSRTATTGGYAIGDAVDVVTAGAQARVEPRPKLVGLLEPGGSLVGLYEATLWIMAGALDCRAVEARLLSYEGPFSVGYGVASFLAGGEDPARDFGAQYAAAALEQQTARRENEDAYVRLARFSLETFVNTGREAAKPAELLPELTDRQAGCFVSLKKNGQLRGCIGTMAPVQRTLAEEIMNNAVSAAVYDPRFPAVQPEELGDLVYSVDVLTPLEPISSAAELDVKRYGVVVRAGRKRGLLLPDLEGVDTPEQQIAIAREKAGIAPETEVTLYRFEVVRHQ